MKLKRTTTRVLTRVMTMLVLLHASTLTHAAATHGDDFKNLYEYLQAWSQGTLGRSIALVFLLVGLGVGAIRGSILGAVSCLAAALALVIAPNVIDTIFTV